MLNSTDVFVIGGGPAGLATAIAARRQGFRVVVADGAKPPIDKACGEALMPDAITALERLGIAVPVAEARPVCGVRFLGSGLSAEADFLSLIHISPILILALTSDTVPVARLYDTSDSILAQKLAPVSYTHLDVYKRQSSA